MYRRRDTTTRSRLRRTSRTRPSSASWYPAAAVDFATVLRSPAPLVLDLETTLARLPAQARAELEWARKPIQQALARLRTEALTDALIVEVADAIAQPMQSVSKAASLALSMSSDDSRAALMQEIQREEELLVSFLRDEDSTDSLRWILGLLRSVYQHTAYLPKQAFANLSDGAWNEAYARPEMKHLLQAYVALMATAEEARAQGSPERAADLIDVAFLELSSFRRLAKVSALSPFPFETLDDRRARLLTYSDRLRDSLGEADWGAIEAARMRELR